MFQRLFLICLLTVSSFAAAQQQTLIHNATIHTMATPAEAEALSFDSDGRITAVGSTAELTKKFPDAKRVDAQGAVIVPGLIDAHGHVMNLGLGLLRADLRETQSKQEILQRLSEFEASLPADSWLLGRGWDQNDWPEKAFPTRQDLDQAFPERPVWLVRIDGHAAWGNSAALAATDRNFSGDWQPEGGKIERDTDGEATGVFIDRAMDYVQNAIPDPSDAELDEALSRALDHLAAVGITGVHEAGTSLPLYRRYQKLQQQGKLKVRIYAMAAGDGPLLDYLCKNGAQVDPTARLTARSVKLYADGALGSRGAALLEDYSDDPGNKGLLQVSEAALGKLIDKAMGCGLQVNTHAIGDRGNRVVLDLYEQSIAAHADHVGRHRIEHAQVVALEDFPRFQKMGLIASVQPTHATSDMYWAEQRVGPKRIKGAYAWQRFLDVKVPLALGSDFPVERASPLLGIYASVSRQDLKEWPEDGWYPDQALTPHEAVYGFTAGAAYAAFQEQQLGTLEPGKYADLTVLATDPMKAQAAKIPSIKVLATIVQGETTYKDTGWSH